jgi:hypothetical protein
MRRTISERRVVDVLVSSLRRSHCVGREVRHYEKRIDVVVCCSSSNELWSIEAKIDNWAKAISQAVVNLAATERSYIAIYARHAHRVPHNLLHQHGIGLISVGAKWGEVEIILAATASPFVNRLACDRIRQTVLRGGTG